jgi:flavin reductase (DIM6/NTAB) family NADH-FMN oxidoreductase RutF
MSRICFDSSQIDRLDKQTRVHLINSLGGFKSVVLVGSTSYKDELNLAIFSSVVHIGAHPPLVGLIFRPSPPQRDTLTNILETGFYTLNHLNEAIFAQGHQTSARYEAEVSEFEQVGLTPEFKSDFKAPFVEESAIQLGLKFMEQVSLTINNTALIIGQIIQIHIPENCLMPDGFVDLEKAGSVTCSGLDSYHKTQVLDRLSYAKADKSLTSLMNPK